MCRILLIRAEQYRLLFSHVYSLFEGRKRYLEHTCSFIVFRKFLFLFVIVVFLSALLAFYCFIYCFYFAVINRFKPLLCTYFCSCWFALSQISTAILFVLYLVLLYLGFLGFYFRWLLEIFSYVVSSYLSHLSVAVVLLFPVFSGLQFSVMLPSFCVFIVLTRCFYLCLLCLVFVLLVLVTVRLVLQNSYCCR